MDKMTRPREQFQVEEAGGGVGLCLGWGWEWEGTRWPQMPILGGEERKKREKKQKTRKKKKIVLPDDSFVARQTFPYSRATCHSYGPSLPLPQNAVTGGGDILGILGWHLKHIVRTLSLWQRECCHLTHVTICVCVNSTSAPNSCYFHLWEVHSC